MSGEVAVEARYREFALLPDRGDRATFERWLADGTIDPNWVSESGYTTLDLVGWGDDGSTWPVELVLAAGADPNGSAVLPGQPLSDIVDGFCQDGHCVVMPDVPCDKVAKVLLDAGADPDLAPPGRPTPREIAWQYRWVEGLEWMGPWGEEELAYREVFDQVRDIGLAEVQELLLDWSRPAGPVGQTLLFKAARERRLDIVEWLLATLPDPLIEDRRGDSVSRSATSCWGRRGEDKHARILEALLEAGDETAERILRPDVEPEPKPKGPRTDLGMRIN